MKAIHDTAGVGTQQSGLILLFDGEVSRSQRVNNWDEHNSVDILASGFKSRFRLPDLISGIWKFVSRYSGATALEFHEVPCTELRMFPMGASAPFKELTN
jgi:hypothetical protein